ncbi:hypothetical protein [uncultured Roseobacter sp.]|uniref:hypothetical protein n=1 Tax=uncultured Roseobacter sp. TaxID=114847 RepID=UPI00261BE488|nr:hypothetical protein [uncultured Roseobacter sp.]
MSEATIRSAPFSYAAIGFGASALFLALLIVYAGPFAPQPDIGTTIGEIAGNMRAAAQHTLQGVPHPEATVIQRTWDIDRILMVGAPALGVVGLVMAIVAFIRREPKRAAACGMALSLGAILVQVLLVAVLIIAGVMLLIGIMQNMDSILG